LAHLGTLINHLFDKWHCAGREAMNTVRNNKRTVKHGFIQEFYLIIISHFISSAFSTCSHQAVKIFKTRSADICLFYRVIT